MSKIRQSLLAVLLFQALAPMASAQSAEKIREYGISLDGTAGRSWDEDGYTSNDLNARGAILFMNENFHFGPMLNVSRTYGNSYSRTSLGLGLAGRWTYENIQTADRTLFVDVSASLVKGESGDWDSTATATAVGVGYEMFLNPFVSLGTSIVYNKVWSETEYDDADIYDSTDDKDAYASARLHLGLNIYL